MDIDRLTYFCVLAQTVNMRKAAELLRISPPALSKAIKVLEEEAGYKLITPSGRGIILTDQGRYLAERGAKIIAELNSLKGSAATASGAVAPLRIGSFEVFTTYFLGLLAEKELFEVPLLVHELVPGQIEAALLDRQVDVGLTYIAIPSPDLDHIRVGSIEMGIFACEGFKHRGEEIGKLPFAIPITPIAGAPTKVQGLDGWPDDRVPRNARYKVTLMESALELCRRGLAAAYLPTFVAELHNRTVQKPFRLQRLPLPKNFRLQTQPVYLIKRKGDLENPYMRKIAKALRTL